MRKQKGSGKQMRIRYKSNLSAGCLAVLGAIILFLIIPSQVGLENQSVQGVTSRSLPYALSVLMGGCGAGLIFQSLVLKRDEVKELEIKQEVKGICYMLLLLGYGYAFSRSFLVSTILLGVATLAFTKCKKISYYAIIIVSVVALYFVFTHLLHVRLP